MVRVKENINQVNINTRQQIINNLEAKREILTEITKKLSIGPCQRTGKRIAKVGWGKLKEIAPSCLKLQQELTSYYISPTQEERKALTDLKTQLETIKEEENQINLTSHRNKTLAICRYLSERV